MTQYLTPGVYVEEKPTLPPSVAEVSTAIPAFFGYTQKGAGTIARISTLLDFEQRFGVGRNRSFTVTTIKEIVKVPPPPPTKLEGGGTSSITSLDIAVFTIDKLARDDKDKAVLEHRLYDAVSLYFMNGGGPCYIVSVGDFTAPLAEADFKAGLTALEKEDEPTLIVLTDAIGLPLETYHNVCQLALKHCDDLKDRFAILDVQDHDKVDEFRNKTGTTGLKYGAAYVPHLLTTLVEHYSDETVTVILDKADKKHKTLKEISTTHAALYNQIKAELAKEFLTMPPSAAIAGVYASVDRSRGVWKAPANVSLLGVIAPKWKINDVEQERLNVDPASGKSINAIRAFAGKGVMVWGARTLMGSDNEWRYIPVRRLFNLIEESTRKASAFAVFEPNDETTWLKVKGMIDSYLYGLWERGALAGPTPAQAYFVNVGLGKTMTTQDILEGRMIVEIGIAAVRPAEFVILRFTHKLQEA